jgi:hypothetical protein
MVEDMAIKVTHREERLREPVLVKANKLGSRRKFRLKESNAKCRHLK